MSPRDDWVAPRKVRPSGAGFYFLLIVTVTTNSCMPTVSLSFSPFFCQIKIPGVDANAGTEHFCLPHLLIHTQARNFSNVSLPYAEFLSLLCSVHPLPLPFFSPLRETTDITPRKGMPCLLMEQSMLTIWPLLKMHVQNLLKKSAWACPFLFIPLKKIQCLCKNTKYSPYLF